MEWQDVTPILNIPFTRPTPGKPRNFQELQKGVKDWHKRASQQWYQRQYQAQQTRVFSTPFVSNAKPFLFFNGPPPKELGIDPNSPLVIYTGQDYASEMKMKRDNYKQPFIQQPLLYERAGGNQFEKGPGLSVMKPNPAPPYMDASNEFELVKRVRFIDFESQKPIRKVRPEMEVPGARKTILRRRKGM